MDEALITELLEAGTPAHLVAKVAMALAQAAVSQQVIEARRSKDRERQNKRRSHVTSRDITGHDVTSEENPSPLCPPLKVSPDPFKITPPISPQPGQMEARAKASTAARLPDDWRPSRLDRSTASGGIIESRGQEWAKVALESFRNHWRSANGPNARKRDWQAAWANWVIEQDRRDGRHKRTNNLGGYQPADEQIGRTAQAARNVIAELERRTASGFQ